MSDAVDTVQNRYTRFTLGIAMNPAASAEAALAERADDATSVPDTYRPVTAIRNSDLDGDDVTGRQVANDVIANSIRPVR